MTKRLTLFRHAKASNANEGQDDFSRGLNERGLIAAHRMGQELATITKEAGAPAAVYCSDSTRTKESCEALCVGYGEPLTVQYHNSLYLASQGDLLDFINNEADDKAEHILLIGHNPGFHLLAMTLAGHGDIALRGQLMEKYPTATLCSLSFNTEHWKYVTPQRGTLTHYIRPEYVGVGEDVS